MEASNLATVKQLSTESGGAFSESALRALIFRAAENGLSTAIFRIGRKILVDRHRFAEWIDQHRIG